MSYLSTGVRVLGLGLAVLSVRTSQLAAQAVWQADVVLQNLRVARLGGQLALAPKTDPALRSASITSTRQTRALSTLPSGIEINVDIYSYHDDDAQSAQVRIFLPVQTRPLSMPNTCQPSQPLTGAPDQSIAFVTCDLGQMAVGATRTVQLTITEPPSYVVPRIGAFAWSASPDPIVANNYAEKVVP